MGTIFMHELYHHGILGQKWGTRNGPPYPLSGGDYSKEEVSKTYRARIKGNSIYNKKHFDKTIKEGVKMRTLSYDKDRTKDTDMFFAAYDTLDKHEYNSLFNRKVPQTIYDEKGNEIGTGEFYKFAIDNTVVTDLKVASEDSAASAFLKLYSSNRDFSNFVRDPDRMQSLFVNDKYKFKGYRESRAALEKIRKTDMPDEKDLRTAYRMFNYVIPNDGGGNARKANDIKTQRAKLFHQLSKEGFGALLDTNDSIYGGFKANAPVIVFDMEKIAFSGAKRIGTLEKIESGLIMVGKKALGL